MAESSKLCHELRVSNPILVVKVNAGKYNIIYINVIYYNINIIYIKIIHSINITHSLGFGSILIM